MGANYYFKDKTTDKFLIYETKNNEEHIYGDYSDLKSLSSAITWLAKYKDYYSNSKFRIKKVRISVDDMTMTQDEDKHIQELITKKNINVICN